MPHIRQKAGEPPNLLISTAGMVNDFTLASYLRAVISHWASFATGGVIMGLFWLLKDVAGVPIPSSTNIVLAVFFFGLVSYLTWRDAGLHSSAKVQAVESESRQQLDVLREELASVRRQMEALRGELIKANLGLDVKKMQYDREGREIFAKCTRELNEGKWPLQALIDSGAGTLDLNEYLVSFIEDLEARGYDNPLQFWDIPKSGWPSLLHALESFGIVYIVPAEELEAYAKFKKMSEWSQVNTEKTREKLMAAHEDSLDYKIQRTIDGEE